MEGLHHLSFSQEKDIQDLLPRTCTLDLSCLERPELREAVAMALQQQLCTVAAAGIDLNALRGITVATDCAVTAAMMQNLPAGQVALDVRPQPESMDLARTVAIRREGGVDFHIVLRKGLALSGLSPEFAMQQLAQACLAHEGAHVEHESYLYSRFPQLFGGVLECGERSRYSFLKAIDAWSEYAACRSAAMFRPEALEDFQTALCCAIETSTTRATEQIRAYRDDGDAKLVFHGLQQTFGDVFVYAGYLLGHLHGLETNLSTHLQECGPSALERQEVNDLLLRLERVVRELWFTEFAWQSSDVFIPIYDVICELMARHGVRMHRSGDEWRIVMQELPSVMCSQQAESA